MLRLSFLRDSSRSNYHALITVRKDKRNIGHGYRNIGKLAVESDYEEVFTPWGLVIKEPDAYERFDEFRRDTQRLLASIAAPYRQARQYAQGLLNEHFPIGRRSNLES